MAPALLERRTDASSDHLRDDLVSLWIMELNQAGHSNEGIASAATPTDGVNAIGLGLLLAPSFPCGARSRVFDLCQSPVAEI